MLVEIGDKVVSTQLFERKFVCDLNACKGACCVEGDAGAPLTLEEVDLLEDSLEHILPFMRPEGILEVERNGVFYMDDENEPVTALVNGGECAFVYFDDQGITKCAVEQAYNLGKTKFKKPISCHLYPIRVKQFHDFNFIEHISHHLFFGINISFSHENPTYFSGNKWILDLLSGSKANSK